MSAFVGCGGSTSTQTVSSTSAAPPTRVEHRGDEPVATGEAIEAADVPGRLVFDDFEDVFVMDANGLHVVTVAASPGPEFDGDLSPDGQWVVYRDSTRGINEDD